MLDRQQIINILTQWKIPIFLHPDYLDHVLGENNWQVVFEELQETQCLFFYYKKSKLSLDYITMHPMVKFMGPYFNNYTNPKNCNSLVEKIMENLPKVHYFNQQWHPNTSKYCESFLSTQKVIERSDYLLDFSIGPAQHLTQIKYNYRRVIKQYESDLITVEVDPITVYELLLDSLPSPDSLGMTKQSFCDFINFIEHKNFGKSFVFEYQQQPVATVVLLWDQHTAYYLLAGNSKSYREINPGVLAAWKIINYLHSKGVNHLDFLGSSIPSIADVWRRLGAAETNYPSIELKASSIFNTLYKVNNWIR